MKKYYLGLDIGTDSVGYAVSDEAYDLMRFKGEPVWGVTTFEAASPAADRRTARVSRRRYDRRQQRVQLVSELFAEEIGKTDPNFFIRRKESALFAEDATAGVKIFDGGITDREYYKRYPTIHHLIAELMTSEEPHDIRLVYLAVAWLVANRGHFLFDVSVDEVGKLMDFSEPYEQFRTYLADLSVPMPWADAVAPDTVLGVMQLKSGSTRKLEAFKAQVYGGKAISKKREGEFPFNRNEIAKLLCGGTSRPKDLFFKEEYKDVKSVALTLGDADFSELVMQLGEDGELLSRLRAMYDCSMLISGIGAGKTVSQAKVEVYEQHKADLQYLKSFLRKYKPTAFNPMFRAAGKENYVAYSYHVKSCRNPEQVNKKANKQAFSDYLKKVVKGIDVSEEDRAQYEDMLNRLELQIFLPKQKDTDNRVIPMQLYHYELSELLRHASCYLPMLTRKDETGLTTAEKLLSIFSFRVPYFVGPLNPASSHAWLKREPGKIYPWNFEQMVDLDASEQEFIRKMTNKCTYWPGKDVLPVNSLLYERFVVLNAINNLKINGNPIPVETKQALYQKLFLEGMGGKRPKPVTFASIRKHLESICAMGAGDTLSGVDETYKGYLKTYHSFRRMLTGGILTEAQVEDIVNHAAYSEDGNRFERFLLREYPALSSDDRKYIRTLKLKEFGRLSREFLTELVGANRSTGEAGTILEMLWDTNDNLMQLLSDRYTFRERLDEEAADYYAAHRVQLSERLDEMYISNAVKRPIIRTLDVTADVVKAMGCAPQKIFVEMARGGTEEQKGKRTQSRKDQLLALYKKIKTEDARQLAKELEAMGAMADNRLQSEKLYLYYLQLGKCMYTGEAIDLTSLFSDRYDIDHIYPRRFVKDDSILNNKVLVTSKSNGSKGERYPIDEPIRLAQRQSWEYLHSIGLMNDEKFRRLTRATGFTEEEKYQFINRQLVETRQSTKAVAQLLKEKYPDTEIVYVKAGLVSEFRREFEMLKSRAVNDLHHAKDAYLNIVVGNVYTEKFTKKWFRIQDGYTLNTKPLYTYPVICGGKTVWQGQADVEKVKRLVNQKNNVHVVQYPYCRHSGQNGGMFDQNLAKAREGLIPRKSGAGNEVYLDTAKYGGYNGSTTTFFVLVSFVSGKKKEVALLPVDLMYAKRFLADSQFAGEYVQRLLTEAGKNPQNVTFLLGSRVLKINTVLTLDGFPLCLTSGSVKDGRVGFLPMMQLVVDYPTQRYIKRLETFAEKRKQNAQYQLIPEFDKITAEENLKLYDLYSEKLENTLYSKRPGVTADALRKNREVFCKLDILSQVETLRKIHMIFVRQPGAIDLTGIGLSANSFKTRKRMYLSGWKKDYSDVRILDYAPSGLYVSKSGNLLELL